MAGGVGAAVLGEKLKSLRGGPGPHRRPPPHGGHHGPHGGHGGPHGGPHDLMVDLMDHMDGILEILTVFQAIEVWKVVDSTEMMAVNEFWKCCCTLVAQIDLYRSKLYNKLSTCESSQKTGRRIGCCWLDC